MPPNPITVATAAAERDCGLNTLWAGSVVDVALFLVARQAHHVEAGVDVDDFAGG